MSAVVLPAAFAMGLGIRLLNSGGDREGLRAGRNSRVVIHHHSLLTPLTSKFPNLIPQFPDVLENWLCRFRAPQQFMALFSPSVSHTVSYRCTLLNSSLSYQTQIAIMRALAPSAVLTSLVLFSPLDQAFKRSVLSTQFFRPPQCMCIGTMVTKLSFLVLSSLFIHIMYQIGCRQILSLLALSESCVELYLDCRVKAVHTWESIRGRYELRATNGRSRPYLHHKMCQGAH